MRSQRAKLSCVCWPLLPGNCLTVMGISWQWVNTHTGAHTQVPYEKKIFFVTTNRVGRERLKEEMETNNRGHPTRLQNDLELTTTMCAIINHFMNWERQNVRCIISLPYNRQLRFRTTKNATNPPFPQGGHVLPSLEQIKSFRGTMEMYIITGFS